MVGTKFQSKYKQKITQHTGTFPLLFKKCLTRLQGFYVTPVVISLLLQLLNSLHLFGLFLI